MLTYLLLALLLAWLIYLTYALLKMQRHYRKLSEKTGKHRIDDVLDTLVEDDQRLKGEVETMKKTILQHSESAKLFLKKVGLIRFSPFGRAGNDQSFVVSLLDSENNGLVINYIYTSEGLRVYTKKVKSGKGEEYPLSEEEEKAEKVAPRIAVVQSSSSGG